LAAVLARFMPLNVVAVLRLQRRGANSALFVCALFLACLAALPAEAQVFRYRVEIDAPEPLRTLLQQYLKIVARQSNAQMSLDQLRRMSHETPAEIGSLLATEGYFSPVIDASLEDRNGWVARFVVKPGPQARVSAVQIDFTGEISQSGEQNERQRARAREAWYLDKGTVFRQSDWDKAKRTLLQGVPA
jgi:translocation and assembly module TamA